MVNATASPSFRHSFDVLIPHDASTRDAINKINIALSDLEGTQADMARAKVERPQGINQGPVANCLAGQDVPRLNEIAAGRDPDGRGSG